MFRQLVRQFRTHRLASQIRQLRTDLRPLTDEQIIEQYLNDQLLNRQAAADLGKPYPMNTLYRRVLLHVGLAPKAIYIERVYWLQRICQQQDALIQTSAETSEVMRDYEEQLLSTTQDLLQQLACQEANQRINGPVRRN